MVGHGRHRSPIGADWPTTVGTVLLTMKGRNGEDEGFVITFWQKSGLGLCSPTVLMAIIGDGRASKTQSFEFLRKNDCCELLGEGPTARDCCKSHGM
jgi:hypothetical protein